MHMFSCVNMMIVGLTATEMLTGAETLNNSCGNHLIKRWLAHASMSVPLITFIDKMPADVDTWLLGLTAAANGVPLIITGLKGGRRQPKYVESKRVAYNPMQKSQKWYGFETALRLLPSAPAVMFADGFDVLVANAPTPDLVAKLPPRQVLWGAECNSWPQCLKARYDNHTAHRACLTRSQACFLNTGMGIGSPIAWRLLLDRLLPMMLTAQHADDQGAVHELYIQQLALEEQRQQLRTKPGSQLGLVGEIEIAVDDQSRFGVNVFLCRGTSSYGKRGPPKSERCSYGKYSPAERLSVVGDALHFASANAGPQRPVLLHVAGNPPGQSKAARIAPLAGLISHAAAVAGPNLDQRLVLLVDTVDGQSACRLASLGKLTKVPSQQELATGPVWKM